MNRLMDTETACLLLSLWLEVQINKGPIIYRPHHAHYDWEGSILSSISELRGRHPELALMIGGDFNVDMITRNSDKLRENMRLVGMLWQQTGPTHYDIFMDQLPPLTRYRWKKSGG